MVVAVFLACFSKSRNSARAEWPTTISTHQKRQNKTPVMQLLKSQQLCGGKWSGVGKGIPMALIFTILFSHPDSSKELLGIYLDYKKGNSTVHLDFSV